MSTYQITVSKDGNHLFTTQAQPIGCDYKDRDDVAHQIAEAFPKNQGYEVSLITWPSQRGDMKNISC